MLMDAVKIGVQSIIDDQLLLANHFRYTSETAVQTNNKTVIGIIIFSNFISSLKFQDLKKLWVGQNYLRAVQYIITFSLKTTGKSDTEA